jgi:hypothetical protein
MGGFTRERIQRIGESDRLKDSLFRRGLTDWMDWMD